MRVIGGSARGRKLLAVPGTGTRPTADRVRESLFNILAERPVGAQVLDLFAGTGALAIEALSRGARRAVLVESGRRAAGVIRRNLEACGFQGQAELLVQRDRLALPLLARRGDRFELVFLDPPYGKGLAGPALEALGTLGLVAPGGLVVLETRRGEEEPGPVPNLSLHRQVEVGSSALWFLVGEEGEA
ncbi:16S rRNA (guanine(966)-N(2))-methyltransferase RsmD [Limnochorda pilosa]|uniref:Methyltransferase n=1 Tax=Limnochorda pilosa TaxID=1555112 RepID=A0A0K2SK06_LIMPI|nr:16S rRNA (guanine(966)-N(2))-methyltransferase RsmD [Limnochorda pilosa]BAS27453.1 methyltransferase [Limnochorda pilosa]